MLQGLGKRRLAAAMAMMLGVASFLAPARAEPLPPPRPAELDRPDSAPPLPLPRPPDLDRQPTPLVRGTTGPVFGPDLPDPPATVTGPTAEPNPTPGSATPLPEEVACARLLGRHVVEARVLDPIRGTGGCGIAAPIEVSAILAHDGRRVTLEPPITVGCPFADTLADWLREDLVPAFDRSPSGLAALVDSSGFTCRGRDHLRAAKISEHAKGNAADIGQFRTQDHRLWAVSDRSAPILRAVRDTACARFSTVLGPGSDSYHATHLHLDIAERRHGYKICQWAIP